MTQYNMLDAKNNLSKICKMVSENEEDFIVIASNGKPLVKIVPYENKNKRILGIYDGKYKIDDKLFDSYDKEIEEMFYGEE